MKILSSFRDSSGFMFLKKGVAYRQINRSFKENYDFFMRSGLYNELVQQGLLIPHEEVSIKLAKSKDAYKIIEPLQIPFISYPYEWSFSQLKDAALVTLKIQKIALEFGMSLKDCSAYNIQFLNGQPILIDTLSLEKYDEEKSWVAPYRQFCRHFLAPLSLMVHNSIFLHKLSCLYIDGIPLDLASSLLPLHTKINHAIFFHIYLNSKLQTTSLANIADETRSKMNRKSLIKLVVNLEKTVKRMRWQPKGTVWAEYYSEGCANYSQESLNHKKELVKEYLQKCNAKGVLDLGANIGLFSRIASSAGIQTLSLDNDPGAVEKNYLECKAKKEKKLLPLIIDLTNPSPDIGWENSERISFLKRNNTDTTMALALIHHLVFSNNLPFQRIASFFNSICYKLIIEFIPITDSNAKRLLRGRENLFLEYNQENFEKEFSKYFIIQESHKIKGSGRTLYLMINRKIKSRMELGGKVKKSYWLIGVLIGITSLGTSVSAYIDPGTGAIIIGGIWNLIVALFTALIGVLIKVFWKPIKKAFLGKRQVDKGQVQEKSKQK